jgi:hypothetical protein
MRTREEFEKKFWETREDWGQTLLFRARITELEDEVRQLREQATYYKTLHDILIAGNKMLNDMLIAAISSQPCAGGRHLPPDTQKGASQ